MPRGRSAGSLITGKVLEAADRHFQRLPLPPDQYGPRFFAGLAGVLVFTGAAYWSIHAHWDVDWFAREDGLLEWGATAMYVVAAAIAAMTARRLFGFGHPRLGVFHAALATALVLGALEEISWGQRLFDWSTPAGLGDINKQDETNLHNVEAFEDAIYAFIMWGCMFGLAGAAVRAFLHHHRRVTTADFVLPSLILTPALALIVIWTGEGRLIDGLRGLFPYAPLGSEFPEVLLGMCVIVYAYGSWRRVRQTESAHPSPLADLSEINEKAKPRPPLPSLP